MPWTARRASRCWNAWASRRRSACATGWRSIATNDLPMLRDGRLDPGAVIQVLSVRDANAECLVKGPVHGQQIRLLHGGTGSVSMCSARHLSWRWIAR